MIFKSFFTVYQLNVASQTNSIDLAVGFTFGNVFTHSTVLFRVPCQSLSDNLHDAPSWLEAAHARRFEHVGATARELMLFGSVVTLGCLS